VLHSVNDLNSPIPCNWTFWKKLKLDQDQDKKKKLKKINFKCGINDQGWGNLKGAIDLKLCRGAKDKNTCSISEWNEEGSGYFSHVI